MGFSKDRRWRDLLGIGNHFHKQFPADKSSIHLHSGCGRTWVKRAIKIYSENVCIHHAAICMLYVATWGVKNDLT